MVAGCIDIGSNTTRVLVADVRAGVLRELLARRSFTRLGGELRRFGELSPEKVDEVAAVVAEQRRLAESAGAERLQAVATAAIRGAANRDALVEAVRERAGLDVRVLSGDEEARLAFLGATRTLGEEVAGPVGVVDVGGGSTEVAVGTLDSGVSWCASLPIGSGVLAAGHFASDPPGPGELASARAEARAALESLGAPRPARGVAVGGSATSLRTVLGPVLDPPALDRALALVCTGSAAAVAERHGLDPERVRLLPAGLLVLAEAARALGVPLEIGRGGLREGVCFELCERGRARPRTIGHP